MIARAEHAGAEAADTSPETKAERRARPEAELGARPMALPERKYGRPVCRSAVALRTVQPQHPAWIASGAQGEI